jgi:hypothetical protein
VIPGVEGIEMGSSKRGHLPRPVVLFAASVLGLSNTGCRPSETRREGLKWHEVKIWH